MKINEILLNKKMLVLVSMLLILGIVLVNIGVKRNTIYSPEIIFEGIVLPVSAKPISSTTDNTTYIFQSYFSGSQSYVPTITVSGKWDISLDANITIVSFTVIEEASTAQQAVSGVAEKMNKIVSKLEELGISRDEIYTKSYSLNPIYDYDQKPPKLVGYRAEHTITISFTDKSLAAKAIDDTSSLGVSRISVAFSVDKEVFLNAYKIALGKAVKEAMDKANIMASSAGVKLGKIISISESGYVSIPRNLAYEGSKSMMTEFYRTELTISASVTLKIEIING